VWSGVEALGDWFHWSLGYGYVIADNVFFKLNRDGERGRRRDMEL
jgi:hypothetical protein